MVITNYFTNRKEPNFTECCAGHTVWITVSFNTTGSPMMGLPLLSLFYK